MIQSIPSRFTTPYRTNETKRDTNFASKSKVPAVIAAGIISLFGGSGVKALNAQDLFSHKTSSICPCVGDLGNYADTLKGFPAYKLADSNSLVYVPDSLRSPKAKKHNIYPRIWSEELDSFKTMHNDAKKDGVSLSLYYVYRTIKDQQGVERIMKNSGRANMVAPPGHTEHHTACANDIEGASEGSKIYNWLMKNGAKYGFEPTYLKKRPKGLPYEPWHWRFNKNLLSNPSATNK